MSGKPNLLPSVALWQCSALEGPWFAAHAVAQWSPPLPTTLPRVLLSADLASWLARIIEATSKSAYSSIRALAVWCLLFCEEEERRAVGWSWPS